MKKATLIICMTVCLGLLVSAPSALASAALDVDCDLFMAATICADSFLPPNYFANMGQLVATSMNDPEAFGFLAMLVLQCSGGLYLLETPVQAMATYGSCGMIPDFIGEVYD